MCLLSWLQDSSLYTLLMPLHVAPIDIRLTTAVCKVQVDFAQSLQQSLTQTFPGGVFNIHKSNEMFCD